MIGDEAREQALAAEGALPERVIACVGGGSNAIGAFYAFLDDPVALIGVEAAGEGLDGAPRRLARRRHDGRAARSALVGARRRRGPDPRGALDLGRSRLSRASAPSTPTCATRAAPRTSRSPTTRPSAAFGELARLEGIIPALEPSHAIAWLLKDARPRTPPPRTRSGGRRALMSCVCGRGDKDMAEVSDRLGDG